MSCCTEHLGTTILVSIFVLSILNETSNATGSQLLAVWKQQALDCNSHEINTILCNDDYSCRNLMLNITNNTCYDVECNGSESCVNIKLFNINNLLCNGDRSCQNMQIFNISNITCNGLLTCIGSSLTTHIDSLVCNYSYTCTNCIFNNINISSINITSSSVEAGMNNVFTNTSYTDNFYCNIDESTSYSCSNNIFLGYLSNFECSNAGDYACSNIIFSNHVNTFYCDPYDGTHGKSSCSYLQFTTIDTFICADYSSGNACSFINVSNHVNTFICDNGAKCSDIFLNSVDKVVNSNKKKTNSSWDNSIIKSGNTGNVNVIIKGKFVNNPKNFQIICQINDTCYFYRVNNIPVNKILQCNGLCIIEGNDKKPNKIDFAASDNCGSWLYQSMVVTLPMTIVQLLIALYWLGLHIKLETYMSFITEKMDKRNVNEKYILRLKKFGIIERCIKFSYSKAVKYNSIRYPYSTQFESFYYDYTKEEEESNYKPNVVYHSLMIEHINNCNIAIAARLFGFGFDIGCIKKDCTKYLENLVEQAVFECDLSVHCGIPTEITQLIVLYAFNKDHENNVVTYIRYILPVYQKKYKQIFDFLFGYQVFIVVLFFITCITLYVEYFSWRDGVFDKVNLDSNYYSSKHNVVYVDDSNWHMYQSFGALFITHLLFYKNTFVAIIGSIGALNRYNKIYAVFVEIFSFGMFTKRTIIYGKNDDNNNEKRMRICQRLYQFVCIYNIFVIIFTFIPVMVVGFGLGFFAWLMLLTICCLPCCVIYESSRYKLSFWSFVLRLVVCTQFSYGLLYGSQRMLYFAGISIFRANDSEKTSIGEYLDWGNNYCTNDNVLLFPNEINVKTMLVWISWLFA